MSAPRREPWKWCALLVIPFVATLWVPFYNHAEPSIDGVPFFYWYLLLCIVLTAGLNGVVYLAIRERR